MTDTVNVSREWLEEMAGYLGATDRNDWSGLRPDDALKGSHCIRVGALMELRSLLAAAPKAEPVSETVRLSLETANYLERIAEEADDNQWQDWAATMRQAAGQMRRLCSAQPEASDELLEALEVWAIEMTNKHGNPNGTDHEQGQNDMGIRVVWHLRTLIAKHKGPQS